MKVVVGLVIGLCIGTWVGAEIVHREYFPILKSQAHEIETLLNTQQGELEGLLSLIERCQTEYSKQYKNGMDFVVNALGIEPINNRK